MKDLILVPPVGVATIYAMAFKLNILKYLQQPEILMQDTQHSLKGKRKYYSASLSNLMTATALYLLIKEKIARREEYSVIENAAEELIRNSTQILTRLAGKEIDQRIIKKCYETYHGIASTKKLRRSMPLFEQIAPVYDNSKKFFFELEVLNEKSLVYKKEKALFSLCKNPCGRELDKGKFRKFYDAIKDFLPKPSIIANANAAAALISLGGEEKASTETVALPRFANLLARIPSPVRPSGSPKRQLPTLDPKKDNENSEQPSPLKKSWAGYISSVTPSLRRS